MVAGGTKAIQRCTQGGQVRRRHEKRTAKICRRLRKRTIKVASRPRTGSGADGKRKVSTRQTDSEARFEKKKKSELRTRSGKTTSKVKPVDSADLYSYTGRMEGKGRPQQHEGRVNLQATRKRPKKKKQKYLFSAVASASAGAAGKWWIDGLMDGHEPYLATLRRRDESAVFCRFLSGCSWLAVSFFFFFSYGLCLVE